MKRARSELCQYQSEWARTNIPIAAVEVMKNVARLDMNRAFRLLSVQVNDRLGDRCQVRNKPYQISGTHNPPTRKFGPAAHLQLFGSATGKESPNCPLLEDGRAGRGDLILTEVIE